MNMRFVDLHCDTLLEMYSKNRDLAELAKKEGIEEIDPADINKKFL